MNSILFFKNRVSRIFCIYAVVFCLLFAVAQNISFIQEVGFAVLAFNDGIFTPGPASSLPFMETYSWLDDSSGLYAAGDDLAVRLQKYSDDAILNRERGF